LANLFVCGRLYIVSRGFENPEKSEAKFKTDYSLDGLYNNGRTRIFRGFYRRAIYGNLFYFDEMRPKTKATPSASSYEQSLAFLCLFLAWQVEELSCVNDILHNTILQKWQEIEDSLYSALVAGNSSDWDVDRKPAESRWESERFFSHSVKIQWH